MDTLKGLNPEQKKAVKHHQGPLLILAGAGSGKTRVLTHRIAHLIYEYGVSPYNILAVTFTNKAAGEMKERIENLISTDSKGIWMSTFHSICVRILRREINKLGYNTNFVIFDSSDQRTLIKNILKELNIDTKKFNPRAILGMISSAKNQLISPKNYESNNYFEEIVRQVYELYQKKLKENNALDFDDLIMKTVELFQEYPLVLEHYQERFKYILVDEYQDVNHAQYKLINLLAEKNKNICVVGDDDQGIYGFRGADISNILSFENDYPNTKVIKLEQNYRSTKKILEAAFGVVSNNIDRKDKKLWTENDEGQDLKLYKASNGQEEADYIANEISRLKERDDYSFNDFSILYRTNAQSRSLEQALIRKEIPYRIIGGLKFYDRKEIKDILAYLRLIYNPDDDISLERIINVPKRGIGNTTIGRLQDYALKEEISLLEAVYQADKVDTLGSRAISRVRSFGEMISQFRAEAEELSVLALTEKVLDKTGYLEELKLEKTLEAESRIENITELLTDMKEFNKEDTAAKLGDYLEEVALIADVDNLDKDAEAVVLMTLHSAKGLEFPIVFLAGMEEGLFPHSMSMNSEAEIEEERRLCYVGITRAEKLLYLTHATYRMVYGKSQYNAPSRFISEIPKTLFGLKEGKKGNKVKAVVKEETKSVETGNFSAGDRVLHQKWGKGTIITVAMDSGLEKATIAFPNEGIKELATQYGKLTKL
ncbi:DNA helicase-2/ATP-dependent DNA helicase PcrA [Orenia metallireducens]|jgi:DNA helicase-2/ATP-dependent DNA helicase PcrA|uniref:ATP-dependent DNA helicase n=1 Tax=Orenia metallireducens TaxID=1413210 RepID=A0A285GF02_9FIRM|nr:DNA helicase PcrA [Orenia metallireducens]PRX32532.1 DNA helicase-2/ATP-dependent DNA helicase PcrA [Orenia metallireducens]SNY20951.1 DNA helicase-2 / ATP-dependent DNA helicase PcrA [Orenia metallireducens]